MDLIINFGRKEYKKYVRILNDILEFEIWGKRIQLQWKDIHLIIGGEIKPIRGWLGKKYLIYTFTNLTSTDTKKKLFHCIAETKDKYKFLYTLEKIISSK